MAQPELRIIQPGEIPPPRTLQDLGDAFHETAQQVKRALPPLREAWEGTKIILTQGAQVVFSRKPIATQDGEDLPSRPCGENILFFPQARRSFDTDSPDTIA